MTPGVSVCLFDSSWSTQPQHGWPPRKPSPAPGGPPVTCVFLFITQECVLRTWGHSPTPLLMQEPPHTPTLTGPGLPHGAGPLSPAGHPNTPVYLRASAQDGSAPDFWPLTHSHTHTYTHTHSHAQSHIHSHTHTRARTLTRTLTLTLSDPKARVSTWRQAHGSAWLLLGTFSL